MAAMASYDTLGAQKGYDDTINCKIQCVITEELVIFVY